VNKKKSILENVIMLLVLGVIAGAVGALGVGVIQLHSMQAASSATATGAPPK
jgi:hypothetical protein